MSHVMGLEVWKHVGRHPWGAWRATHRPERRIKSSIPPIWNGRIKDQFVGNTGPNCKPSRHCLSIVS